VFPCFTEGKKNPAIPLIVVACLLYSAVECILLWERGIGTDLRRGFSGFVNCTG
jgi:hypothetical protein